MRQVILPMLALAVCLQAQIPMRSVARDRAAPSQSTYDSLRNFPGEQVGDLMGQTLFLKGMSLRMRGYGYSGFYTRVPDGIADSRAIYQRGAELNRFNTPYDALAFRYFTVVDVVRSGKGMDVTYPRERTFLKLLDKSNSELLYYEYDPRHEGHFPFVVQGWFHKLRDQWNGRRVLVRRIEGLCAAEFLNAAIVPGDTLTSAGFFVEDRTYTILGSFKRSDGQELYVDLAKVDDPSLLLELSAASRLRELFGQDMFDAVLRGQVKPGMGPAMVEAAIGKPSNVNRIVHTKGTMEEWVYPLGRIVFIENGTVSSVQAGDTKAD